MTNQFLSQFKKLSIILLLHTSLSNKSAIIFRIKIGYLNEKILLARIILQFNNGSGDAHSMR